MRVVFIHGAFSRDGAWWWAPTAALLDRSGIASVAVALPSCGEAGIAPTGAGPGLDEDAAATTAVLDEGGPAIVVAHSYGGIVASQAGKHPAVRGLVYISSFLPARRRDSRRAEQRRHQPGVGHRARGWIGQRQRRRHGRVRRPIPARCRRTRPRQRRARPPLRPILSRLRFGAQTTTAAWERIPSTYLVCAEDRSTNPDLQRAHAARATIIHELAAAHFPMLSRPDLVAACIEETATRAQG